MSYCMMLPEMLTLANLATAAHCHNLVLYEQILEADAPFATSTCVINMYIYIYIPRQPSVMEISVSEIKMVDWSNNVRFLGKQPEPPKTARI